jgi:hypothetical protein
MSYSEEYELTDPSGIPQLRPLFRQSDPPSTTVGGLSPEMKGCRVVIRSKKFLGTVCGVVENVSPHPTLSRFTTVRLSGKLPLTFRNDTECLVIG